MARLTVMLAIVEPQPNCTTPQIHIRTHIAQVYLTQIFGLRFAAWPSLPQDLCLIP